MTPVAALYVDTARSAYNALPGVELVGFASRDGRQQDFFAETRDARLYGGPHPVVAHPPCGPWGMFSWNYKGGEGHKTCAEIAVKQVRALGGVLEHPAHSKLWHSARLPKPGQAPDLFGGYSVQLNQCDFGHKAEKPTWLYICGTGHLPKLPPKSKATHVFVRLNKVAHDLPELPKKERHLTPPRFAAFLVEIARRC
jgi:hypothetical protein